MLLPIFTNENPIICATTAIRDALLLDPTYRVAGLSVQVGTQVWFLNPDLTTWELVGATAAATPEAIYQHLCKPPQITVQDVAELRALTGVVPNTPILVRTVTTHADLNSDGVMYKSFTWGTLAPNGEYTVEADDQSAVYSGAFRTA